MESGQPYTGNDEAAHDNVNDDGDDENDDEKTAALVADKEGYCQRPHVVTKKAKERTTGKTTTEKTKTIATKTKSDDKRRPTEDSDSGSANDVRRLRGFRELEEK